MDLAKWKETEAILLSEVFCSPKEMDTFAKEQEQ